MCAKALMGANDESSRVMQAKHRMSIWCKIMTTKINKISSAKENVACENSESCYKFFKLCYKSEKF